MRQTEIDMDIYSFFDRKYESQRVQKDGIEKKVTDIMEENYPKNKLGWINDADWRLEKKVPLCDIQMERRVGGPRNSDKVDSIAEKIKSGMKMGPVVLIERTDKDGNVTGKYIADGFHRTAGLKKAGEEFTSAYVGTMNYSPDLVSVHASKLNESEDLFQDFANKNPDEIRKILNIMDEETARSNFDKISSLADGSSCPSCSGVTDKSSISFLNFIYSNFVRENNSPFANLKQAYLFSEQENFKKAIDDIGRDGADRLENLMSSVQDEGYGYDTADLYYLKWAARVAKNKKMSVNISGGKIKESSSGQATASKIKSAIMEARKETDPKKIEEKLARCYQLAGKLHEEINELASEEEEIGTEIAIRIDSAFKSMMQKKFGEMDNHLDSALGKLETLKEETGYSESDESELSESSESEHIVVSRIRSGKVRNFAEALKESVNGGPLDVIGYGYDTTQKILSEAKIGELELFFTYPGMTPEILEQMRSQGAEIIALPCPVIAGCSLDQNVAKISAQNEQGSGGVVFKRTFKSNQIAGGYGLSVGFRGEGFEYEKEILVIADEIDGPDDARLIFHIEEAEPFQAEEEESNPEEQAEDEQAQGQQGQQVQSQQGQQEKQGQKGQVQSQGQAKQEAEANTDVPGDDEKNEDIKSGAQDQVDSQNMQKPGNTIPFSVEKGQHGPEARLESPDVREWLKDLRKTDSGQRLQAHSQQSLEEAMKQNKALLGNDEDEGDEVPGQKKGNEQSKSSDGRRPSNLTGEPGSLEMTQAADVSQGLPQPVYSLKA